MQIQFITNDKKYHLVDAIRLEEHKDRWVYYRSNNKEDYMYFSKKDLLFLPSIVSSET